MRRLCRDRLHQSHRHQRPHETRRQRPRSVGPRRVASFVRKLVGLVEPGGRPDTGHECVHELVAKIEGVSWVRQSGQSVPGAIGFRVRFADPDRSFAESDHHGGDQAVAIAGEDSRTGAAVDPEVRAVLVEDLPDPATVRRWPTDADDGVFCGVELGAPCLCVVVTVTREQVIPRSGSGEITAHADSQVPPSLWMNSRSGPA